MSIPAAKRRSLEAQFDPEAFSKLTDQQQEVALKIADIRGDFWQFAEKNLHIKDKSGAIIPLTKESMHPPQVALTERVLELVSQGLPVRLIVLKARQMGISTVIEALIYWWTATHKHVTSMIVGHENESAGNLYNMFRRYYEQSSPLFQPAVKYFTQKDLVFGKEDGTGLQSTIKTNSAKNVDVGRSDTIQLLHASEVGQWRNGSELVAGLMQTVPLLPNTMIFLESTARGIGNYFYDEWTAAKSGESIFEPFFFPWWQHTEYMLEGKIDHYDESEKTLMTIFQANGVPKREWDKKLNWRRWKLREFKSDPAKFKQEYPSTDMEAFLASGQPRFDIDALIRMDTRTKDPVYYTLKLGKGRNIEATRVNESPLKVWEPPIPGEKYTIAVDVSEGLDDSDYSVIHVLKSSEIRTVARWRGRTDPDIVGDITNELGIWYNYALVGVEVNNHGLTTLQRLRDRYYTNLYMRERGADEWFEESTSKMGWKTDSITKPTMIDYLAEVIRDEKLIEPDKVFIREAMSYIKGDGKKTDAQSGHFDDTVIAAAINLQLFQWQFFDKEKLRVKKPKEMVKRKNRVY